MRKFSTAKRGICFHRGEQQHDYYELTRREGGEWRIMRNQGVANTLGGRTGDNNNEWSDSNIVADRAAVWPDVGPDEDHPLPDELGYLSTDPVWPHFNGLPKGLVFAHYGPEVFNATSYADPSDPDTIQPADCERGTIRERAVTSGLVVGKQGYDISVDFTCNDEGFRQQSLWYWGGSKEMTCWN